MWQYLRDGRFIDEQSSKLHFHVAVLNELASVVAQWHMHIVKDPSGRFLGRAAITAVPVYFWSDDVKSLLSWCADLALWAVAAVHLLQMTVFSARTQHRTSTEDCPCTGLSFGSSLSTPGVRHAASARRASMNDGPHSGDCTSSSDSESFAHRLPPIHVAGINNQRSVQNLRPGSGVSDQQARAVAEGASEHQTGASAPWMGNGEPSTGKDDTAASLGWSSDGRSRGDAQGGDDAPGISLQLADSDPSQRAYSTRQSRSRVSLLTQLTRVTTLCIIVMLLIAYLYEQRALRLARSFSSSAISGLGGAQNSARVYHDLNAPGRLLLPAKQFGPLGAYDNGTVLDAFCELAAEGSASSPIDVVAQMDAGSLPWKLPSDGRAEHALNQLLVCSSLLLCEVTIHCSGQLDANPLHP